MRVGTSAVNLRARAEEGPCSEGGHVGGELEGQGGRWALQPTPHSSEGGEVGGAMVD